MGPPDLGSDASSVWNFSARFSDVIWRGNLWWGRQMSAVFSGYLKSSCPPLVSKGLLWPCALKMQFNLIVVV